jgi:sugar phosphate isomerase/epimerase
MALTNPKEKGTPMRIGCLAWIFRPLSEGAPWYEALDSISRLGFKGVELILCREEELETYWTEEETRRVADFCDQKGLQVSQFAIFQPAIGGLTSLDRKQQARALEVFEQCAQIARTLGAPLINYVSQWPIGLEAPIPYVPNYFYLPNNGPNPTGKLTMKLPPNFDWEEQWANVVQATKKTVEIARAYGLKMSLEGHINVAVPHTDSFLRLYDHVGEPDLGYCLDVGWAALQREYVPWSLYKVKGKLVNIHVRDCDHLTTGFARPGEGVLDWVEIFKALLAIGYEGYLSLESYATDWRDRKIAMTREYLEECLALAESSGQ